MITRDQVQPSTNSTVTVLTKEGKQLEARYLMGLKSYEGWYIPSERKVVSQKELKVRSFKNGREDWCFYIPRKELDFIFPKRNTRLDYDEYNFIKLKYDLGFFDI